MRTGYLILALALALVAADAAGKSKGKEGRDDRGRVVDVDCDRGRSLNDALERRDASLDVRVRGTCVEDVVVRRGNVTLRGIDGATIQGSISFDPNDPANEAAAYGAVFMQDLTVMGASGSGISVLAGARVTAELVRVSGSGGSGIRVDDGGHLSCIDCESYANGGNGLIAVSNATVRLEGDGFFSDNAVSGISIGSSAALTLANELPNDPEPVVVTTNGNLENGVVIFGGGSVLVDTEGTVEAHGNGSGPGVGNFGSGFLIGTGSSGFMSGVVNASGNDAGVFSVAGSLLMFGDANVSGNLIGMFVQNDGILRPTGTNTVTDNTFGILMQSGLLQLGPTSFSGNILVDMNLEFGAKVRSAALPGVSVFCDGTVLTREGFACP